jgi:hypothetical protein
MFDKAQKYRDKAEQMRRLADKDLCQSSRNVLIQLAETYERLSRHFQDLAAKL